MFVHPSSVTVYSTRNHLLSFDIQSLSGNCTRVIRFDVLQFFVAVFIVQSRRERTRKRSWRFRRSLSLKMPRKSGPTHNNGDSSNYNISSSLRSRRARSHSLSDNLDIKSNLSTPPGQKRKGPIIPHSIPLRFNAGQHGVILFNVFFVSGEKKSVFEKLFRRKKSKRANVYENASINNKRVSHIRSP